jgi:hypothetical protein
MHMHGSFANYGYIIMEYIKQGSLAQFWNSLVNSKSGRCK